MDYTFGHATDVGRVRDHNEDTYIAVPENGLWAVADGMGGHSAGEIASAIAVEVIAAEVGNGCPLDEAIEKAHQAILQAALEGQGAPGMGCTVVALKLSGYEVEVAWVGDSRAYLWDGALRPLSRDHSFVQQLIDSGAISEEEARHHPQRSVITQALGADELKTVRVDSVRDILARGERLLLCSDGLTGEVDDAYIADVMSRTSDSQQAVEQLIAAANNNGGSDNVTVILVDAPANAPRRKRKGDTVPMRAIGQGKGAGSWRRSGGPTSVAKKMAIALVLLAMLAALLLFWLLRSTKVPVLGGGSSPAHPMTSGTSVNQEERESAGSVPKKKEESQGAGAVLENKGTKQVSTPLQPEKATQPEVIKLPAKKRSLSDHDTKSAPLSPQPKPVTTEKSVLKSGG